MLNNVLEIKHQIMNRKLLKMKDKYNVIYQFMIDILELDDKEALRNTLKLEGVMSKNVLKRLKCFIIYTNNKLLKDPEYIKSFNKYNDKEIKDEEIK